MRFLRRLRSHSVRLRLCSGAQLISRTGSLLRVKTGRTRTEHMSSVVHPITDVEQHNRFQTEQRTVIY
jgi:hypothetical protein